jgi:hypothetical protein
MSTDHLDPIDKNPDPSMWVDEAIWGHRLYDEQTPWFVYLEFLNVVASAHERGELFSEVGGYNRLAYRPAQRLYLRNILFNFPLAKMQEIIRVEANNAERWERWREEMLAACQGIVNPEFGYLEHRFEHFDDFVEVIRLVHSCCLEMQSNKRWTSKFVFPFCKEALFEDLDRKARTNDRRFFGRTGELVYLMLCRASRGKELGELLEMRFLHDTPSLWGTIVKSLQPETEEGGKERPGGFLPWETHPCFDSLCEDLISLFSLDMPDADVTPLVVNMIGFHVMRYQQCVARDTIGAEQQSFYVAEIIAPRKTLVRELSINSYQSNNTASTQAVGAFVDAIENSPEWTKACSSAAPYAACREFLANTVLWPRKDDDYTWAQNSDDLLLYLRSAVRRRHAQHVGNVHRVYGKAVGFVSKRGTNRLRYSPSDSFLRSLVLANVPVRMELGELLKTLYARYDIVIGDKEAEEMLASRDEDMDKKAFQNNAERLEQRMGSVGLLRRLSDGCAYVINPYAVRMND